MPPFPAAQRGPGASPPIAAYTGAKAAGAFGRPVSPGADTDSQIFHEADGEFAAEKLDFAGSTLSTAALVSQAGRGQVAASPALLATRATVAQTAIALPAVVLPAGRHPGSAATTGIFRLGFSTDYTETTSVQLTRWMTQAQAVTGFRLVGRVDAGGDPSLEHDWKIASLADVPGEKGTVDHRTLHGDATIFSSYADFTASAALASAWHLPRLAGRAAANLLDLTFPSNGSVPTPFIPFPHAPGFGLAEPDAWETAGAGQDSANFELNGNYTDWFAPGTPAGLHDEVDFSWGGAARAATLELSLLQTVASERVGVELFHQGRLVYAGNPAPIAATGKFQAGNPSIATISLANLADPSGNPVLLVFDELRLRAASGSFLVNGLALTMADNTTTPIGGRSLILSADATANAAQILYTAPAAATFGGTGAAAGGDGVLDISHFDLDRGDQLVLLKTDLVQLQITPTNAGSDLALRFLNDKQALVLLRGAGSLNVAASFHAVTVGGTPEVVLTKSSIPI